MTRATTRMIGSTISWLPVLLLLAGVAWILVSGIEGLERITDGSEFFVSNDATSNAYDPISAPSDQELLQAALDSGDPARMEAALAQLEERHADRVATRGTVVG